MNVIETDKLHYRYRRTDAVNGLDLAVPEGSIYALLGPNGAGKTTTLKLLMNLLRPGSGHATVLGVASTELSPVELAAIGYVSENQVLPSWMSVDQLVDYCRPLYPTWDRDLEGRLRDQLELPGDRKLKHLSRGMLMKAALLVSLSYRPKLLILDEPFSGLDPLARDDFARGLLEASTAGDWTILVSTHDIEEVERLCDWVGMIESGRLVGAASTDSLLARFRRVEVANVAAPPATRAESWLDWEQTEGATRFADRDYAEGRSESAYAAAFPGASIQTRPMTLREIFIAQARSSRRTRKGAA